MQYQREFVLGLVETALRHWVCFLRKNVAMPAQRDPVRLYGKWTLSFLSQFSGCLFPAGQRAEHRRSDFYLEYPVAPASLNVPAPSHCGERGHCLQLVPPKTTVWEKSIVKGN